MLVPKCDTVVNCLQSIDSRISVQGAGTVYSFRAVRGRREAPPATRQDLALPIETQKFTKDTPHKALLAIPDDCSLAYLSIRPTERLLEAIPTDLDSAERLLARLHRGLQQINKGDAPFQAK